MGGQGDFAQFEEFDGGGVEMEETKIVDWIIVYWFDWDFFSVLKDCFCFNWTGGDDVAIGEDDASLGVHNETCGVAAACCLCVK